MFENLTERLNDVFTQLRKRGKLSEEDVDVAITAFADAGKQIGLI